MRATIDVRVILGLVATLLGVAPTAQAYDVLVQKNGGLPVTAFNVTFRVGSADDPKGLEGLAALTAKLLREGGVRAWQGQPARTRAELEEFLFPFAAEIEAGVGKEQISFTVTSSATDSTVIFKTLAQILLAPAFDESEFERLRAEALDALGKQWPREDEEELGKAALDRLVWGKGHPYAHVVDGTVAGVKSITLEKLRKFYADAFTQKRLTVGVAGVVSPSLEKQVRGVFKGLPVGATVRTSIASAPEQQGLRLLIVKGPFDATGVHLGEPLAINRASAPEIDRLYLASLAFGKHRSFVGRLMKIVREIRSLNYGTFSYVEDFPGGGRSLVEPTQAARTRQAFTVWGRPTPLENGCFLLRLLHREVSGLVEKGLTPAEFRLGQSHLVGNAPLLGTGLERRLGYAIDSKFYGIQGDYLKRLQRNARSATRAAVNAAIKKNIDPRRMAIVVVTPNPEKFKEQILGASCPVTYAEGSSKPESILNEDKQIATYKLPLSAEQIEIIDSEELF